MWSDDARAMVSPSRTFTEMVARPPAGAWVAWRRPLLLGFLLASVASLAGAGVLTFRIVAPAFLYWMSVPIVEVAAVTIVTFGRRPRAGWARLVDAHFAGHAPWTVLLIAIAGSIASFSPPIGWTLVMGVWLWSMVGVLAWSAWIDLAFYRSAVGADRRAAWRDVIVQRAIVWGAVLAIFAFHSFEPRQLATTMGEVVRALFGGTR